MFSTTRWSCSTTSDCSWLSASCTAKPHPARSSSSPARAGRRLWKSSDNRNRHPGWDGGFCVKREAVSCQNTTSCPSGAVTRLNEERPLLSRRPRFARSPDIQRAFLRGEYSGGKAASVPTGFPFLFCTKRKIAALTRREIQSVEPRRVSRAPQITMKNAIPSGMAFFMVEHNTQYPNS